MARSEAARQHPLAKPEQASLEGLPQEALPGQAHFLAQTIEVALQGEASQPEDALLEEPRPGLAAGEPLRQELPLGEALKTERAVGERAQQAWAAQAWLPLWPLLFPLLSAL